MLTVKSITGIAIRLPDERWVHIVEGHPEMAGHLNEVFLAVGYPDIVFQEADELIGVTYSANNKALIVAYKETNADGFAITAYLQNN